MYLNPPAGYSEDIDLVQISSKPIGSTLKMLRDVLDPWLGKPKWKKNEIVSTLIYRFGSELLPITPLRLKVEINTREHFSVMGYANKSMQVKNAWFSGKAEITTYSLE